MRFIFRLIYLVALIGLTSCQADDPDSGKPRYRAIASGKGYFADIRSVQRTLYLASFNDVYYVAGGLQKIRPSGDLFGAQLHGKTQLFLTYSPFGTSKYFIERYHDELFTKAVLPDTTAFSCVVELAENVSLIGTEDGIWVYDWESRTGRFSFVYNRYDTGDHIQTLFAGSENTWIAGNHNGLYLTENAGESWSKVSTGIHRDHDSFYHLFEWPEGRLNALGEHWVVSDDSGKTWIYGEEKPPVYTSLQVLPDRIFFSNAAQVFQLKVNTTEPESVHLDFYMESRKGWVENGVYYFILNVSDIDQFVRALTLPR